MWANPHMQHWMSNLQALVLPHYFILSYYKGCEVGTLTNNSTTSNSNRTFGCLFLPSVFKHEFWVNVCISITLICSYKTLYLHTDCICSDSKLLTFLKQYVIIMARVLKVFILVMISAASVFWSSPIFPNYVTGIGRRGKHLL